jgi:glycyl-tRNA synthetase beta chain
VKILAEASLDLNWTAHLNDDKQLEEFLLDRVRYYFRDVRGFKYDEVNAALAAGYGNIADVQRRLEALQGVRPTENFEPLAASFKRIKNILRQAGFEGDGEVRTELLESGPEAELHSAFAALRQRVEAHRAKGDYSTALEAVASLRPKVDLFFDKVLVNAPDAAVRENRLTLLARMLREFSSIADFSEIVTS